MPDRSDLSPRLAGFSVDQLAQIRAVAEHTRYNHVARRQFLWAYAARTNGTAGAWPAATIHRPYVSFADAATRQAGWWFHLPYDSFGRPIRFRVYWTQSGTATGNFRTDMTVQVRRAGDILSTGSAWLSETVDLAAPAVANELVITTVDPATAIPSYVVDEDTIVSMFFRRLGNDAADTCGDALRLAGIEVSCL